MKQGQNFLCLRNYYRNFVKDFSKISASLTELTRKDNRFVWSNNELDAFRKLKDALLKAPVLRCANPNIPY